MVVDKPLMSGIGSVGGLTPAAPGSGKEEKSGVLAQPSFGDVLGTKIPQNNLKPDAASAIDPKFAVKFSQHALDRMASRGISFKPEDMVRLNDAVDKAAKKGSRETLVLMGDNALIVSVKNKTVVTAMDREAMKENVFTNIDSTVIL